MLSEQERFDLYGRALQKWGRELQLVTVIEELGELVRAVCKVLRGWYSVGEFWEEVADVEIMLEQLRVLMPDEYEQFCVPAKAEKLERLKERLLE